MALIRDARPEDAGAIAAIWNPIIRDTPITFYPLERPADEVAAMIRDRQAAGHGFFVADSGDGVGGGVAGGVIGFSSYSQFRGGPGYARSMEHTIHLTDAARGRGVGRALMTYLHDHARRAGARLMIGAITASNAGSIAFHKRLGYAEWGRIPAAGWKFGRYHDLILLGLDLAPES
ncbi:GNAT family N-acetyltransferase [Paracoccus pacificus]|uniref:GNAT family N-acetyltransferase n=1 Tax=Paracoccus pacificus TaxID=1463598 RepID=A0ABW4R4G7_9RHOB